MYRTTTASPDRSTAKPDSARDTSACTECFRHLEQTSVDYLYSLARNTSAADLEQISKSDVKDG
jgi:hypothetical protein